MNRKSMLLFFVCNLFLLLLLSETCTSVSVERRSLHQPFFLPVETNNAPSASPQSQPKFTLSTTPPKAPEKSFFPTFRFPPPPSPVFSTATPTFPANISSITLPRSSSSVATRHHVIIAVVCSLLAVAAVVAIISAFLFYRRSGGEKKLVNSDNLRLYPPNTAPSDSPEAGGRGGGGNHSSEFLYLGTVINSRGPVSEEAGSPGANVCNVGPRISNSYHKLGSPELRPLPPLVRRKSEAPDKEEEEEEEFFSPRGSSSGGNVSPARNNSSSRRMFGGIGVDNFGSRSCNSRTASYPYSNPVSRSVSNLSSPCQEPNFSPRSPQLGRSLSSSSSTESNLNSKFSLNSPRSNFSISGQSESNLKNSQFVYVKLPPPPPPPLPPRGYWENRFASKVAGELMCARPLVAQANEGVEKNESLKPRLKPLHWDKVRANPNRATVWDQLKPSSFQLNEEMFETLFIVNNTSLNPKYNARRQVLASTSQENRVLDPKKSHNIAILLRALNVTVDEVCEALLDGNADTLGTELLESLLKMAPSKEEECKLKEINDEARIKLGPAEKFLKAVISVPFAFERVNAMLYIANFDSEVEYLRRSFDTLKAACQELKNSRMFLKLLEAVLKTGNRMNIGTNRGDAQAFKLDTLLKLIDIKGTDGRTTLLHFVVQEIIRAEGSRLAGANKNSPTEHSQQSDLRDDVECRKHGLQVVASLSGELMSVKKAATMDSDALSSDVSKLAKGIARIVEVMKLNEDVAVKESCKKFSESMNWFLKKAEDEIVKVQAQMRTTFFLVKEITEYFHGNSEKEEAHPLRIFMVVRDFLSTLDKVCREVGKINDRTTVSTTRQFAIPVYPNIPPVFPGFPVKLQHGSSDDEDSSST